MRNEQKEMELAKKSLNKIMIYMKSKFHHAPLREVLLKNLFVFMVPSSEKDLDMMRQLIASVVVFVIKLISSFHALTTLSSCSAKTIIAFSKIFDMAPALFSTAKVTK